MVIDVQNHIMSIEYARFFEKHSVTPQVTIKGDDVNILTGTHCFTIPLSRYSAKTCLANMDKNGIDVTLVSPQVLDCTLLPDEWAPEGAQIVNNALLDITYQYRGRFGCIGYLPWNQPAEAVKEAKRLKELGFAGVVLNSQFGDGEKPVDLPEYRPVYSALGSLGLPIFLHPSSPPWGRYIKEYSMIPIMGFMVHESFCLLRLILSGILESNPGLRIIMPHCGGVLPYLAGRLWHETINLGIGMEHVSTPPVETLQSDQIYYDLASTSPQTMRFVGEFAGGAHKLMFGSDYPWIETPMLMQMVREAFPDPQDQEMIFSTTAKNLLAL